MPKCDPDLALQRRAAEFVQKHHGNHAAAATALGLDPKQRTRFWKFVRHGKALATTRQDYAERLDRCEERSPARQNATESESVSFSGGSKELSLDEARQIRELCRRVMTMVDFYEASLGGDQTSADKAPAQGGQAGSM